MKKKIAWMSCSGMGLNNLDDSRDGVERFLARNPETCFVAEDGRAIGAILIDHDGRRGSSKIGRASCRERV